MSYHKIVNLGQILQGDLNSKLIKGVRSLDFENLECNCNSKSKTDGKCVYGGKCRHSIVVYKATCKICDKFYVGNTQQKLKLRMNQHYMDVRNLVNKQLTSDSYARHFASHFIKEDNITAQKIRNINKLEILWQGNPISCVKSFGKPSCSLCMKERISILTETRERPTRLINSCNEIYGACRHKTRFHRYKNYTTSTDDGVTPERDHVSISESSTYENSITTGTCSTVLSNNTYQTSTVLEIDTDLNLINSTVQTEEPTGNISPISNYDGSYVHTNLASV